MKVKKEIELEVDESYDRIEFKYDSVYAVVFCDYNELKINPSNYIIDKFIEDKYPSMKCSSELVTDIVVRSTRASNGEYQRIFLDTKYRISAKLENK